MSPRTLSFVHASGIVICLALLLSPTSLHAGASDPSLTPVAPSPGPNLNNPSSQAPKTPPPVPQGETLPEGTGPENSVVQIFTDFQEPLWDNPWEYSSLSRASGSGFLIDGNRIMTNAHVVAWTKRLLVRRYHDPKPYPAEVEFVGHDLDLAIIKVEDPSFYDGMKPLDLGDLPKVRSNVTTYGFPAGGQQISYTRGVVSRIEVQRYVHISNRSFLACQTDAAINPGNSGGPVIQDDKVVGVAFEAITGLENTSYFIPTPMMNHFLDDIKDGHYDGVPESGIRMASLTNQAYRNFLKLPANSKRGVRVDSLLDIPDTKNLIKKDDVILKVGDYPVDEDGTVTYNDNTVGASVAFDLFQDGSQVPLEIMRDGQIMDLKLPIHVYTKDHDLGNQYDVDPPYVVVGGLVFTALSYDYLKTLGDSLGTLAGRSMIYELKNRRDSEGDYRTQPVVLASILNSNCNADMAIRSRAVVDTINGIRINCLADVPKAVEASKQYIVIKYLPDGQFEVMDRAAALLENPKILDSFHIPQAEVNVEPTQP